MKIREHLKGGENEGRGGEGRGREGGREGEKVSIGQWRKNGKKNRM